MGAACEGRGGIAHRSVSQRQQGRSPDVLLGPVRAAELQGSKSPALPPLGRGATVTCLSVPSATPWRPLTALGELDGPWRPA
jgi:hypothetical protein